MDSVRSTGSPAAAASAPPRPPPAAKPAAKAAPPKPATSLSQKGVDLIKSFEGLRTRAYRDAVGVWTIGYGHTGGVKPGQVITKERAEQLLRADTAWAQAAVRRSVKVPLTQGQFDALTSFTFNLGAGALASSTLLKKLNARDYAGAQKEFGKWVHAGGEVLQGLVRRRAAEAKMFGNKAPSGGGTRPPSPSPAPSPAPSPSPSPSPAPTKKNDYRVRAGDTMSGIAAKNHMSLAALAKLNPQVKNLNVIHVGQLIHLSAAKRPAPVSAAKSKTYTVKSGDTFSGIAAKHDLSTAALAKLNPQVKNLNLIHPGEKLVVKKSATPTPIPSAPTPAAPKPPKPPTPSAPTPAPTGDLPKVVPNTSGLSTKKRYALYERYIEKHGDAQAKKDLAAGKRVILALRKDTPMSSGPYEGTYDDRIVVLWKDRSGPHVQELLANTEPNRRWAQPANASSKPVGRLADNQTIRYHKSWSTTFGNHLEPYGNPYAQRDLNRNYKFDKGERSYNGDWGGQAMFIHRAWSTNTGSQGCQTMEEGRFNTFWRALGGQKDFSYVLVNVAKA